MFCSSYGALDQFGPTSSWWRSCSSPSFSRGHVRLGKALQEEHIPAHWVFLASQSWFLRTERMVFMETSRASAQSTASSRSLRQVMRQHPLFFFFLMAYAFSWIVLIPYVLSVWGIMPKFFSFPLGAAAFTLNTFLGPTLAAFIMTVITEGKGGVLR